ncbi:hypothetical protein H6503_05645 [Candidatus Woesearchaeota archaeon]|nr:hypothetical protein [Candidatus Woesearchaeota archaeon]
MDKNLGISECKLLLKQNDIPIHIFMHCRKVNAISRYIADKLIEKGINIDLKVVDKASILHDVKKKHCLMIGKDELHEKQGGELLKSIGFDRIGEVISRHGISSLHDGSLNGDWESMIVHYADKRVIHDKIASLDERIEDAKIRYPESRSYAEKVRAARQILERQIFKNLDIKPEDIDEEAVEPYLIEEEY